MFIGYNDISLICLHTLLTRTLVNKLYLFEFTARIPHFIIDLCNFYMQWHFKYTSDSEKSNKLNVPLTQIVLQNVGKGIIDWTLLIWLNRMNNNAFNVIGFLFRFLFLLKWTFPRQKIDFRSDFVISFDIYSWLHSTCYLWRPQMNSSYVTESNTHTQKTKTPSSKTD